MTQALNLAVMSRPELAKLKARIDKEIAARSMQARRELEALARSAGLPVEELLRAAAGVKPARQSSRPAAPVPPKYRNPNNLQQTWTGRGRQPGWVAAHLSTGRALEALLIDK